MPVTVTHTRILKDITPFLHLVPKPKGTNQVIKRDADLSDTLAFLPKAIREHSWQAKEIAEVLKGKTLYDTCRNIHRFLVERILYIPDLAKVEQIRSVSRLIHDTKGDCDCATVFTSSVLLELQISHVLRVAKYSEEKGFQHIYVIVPTPDNSYITIDFVLDQFDYEEPFIENIDRPMELHFLNGIDGPDDDISFDGLDLMRNNPELDMLGRIKAPKFFKKAGQAIKKVAQKAGQVVKKGLHAVNRVNPATTLLRAGVLASMKLNLFKVASNLKYAYLPDAEAKKRGILMDRFERLKKIREKLEKIFFGAGGKPENLRKAILTGKGNEQKDVPLSGLGYVLSTNFSESDSLRRILGNDVYLDEAEASPELSGLGEPISASAAIGAASGILGTIAVLIKSIGSLFGRKQEEDTSEPAPTEEEVSTAVEETDQYSETEFDTTEFPTEESSGSEAFREGSGSTTTESTTTETTTPNNTTTKEKSWWDKVMEYKKPIGIGAGVIGLAGLTWYFVRRHKKAQEQKPPVQQQTVPASSPPAMSGITHKKRPGRPRKEAFRLKELE